MSKTATPLILLSLLITLSAPPSYAAAISATNVAVYGAEVWAEGERSNAIVAETVNVSNDGKVWSNASGSSAISAKAGGGVTVISGDGTGQVWSNASGSSTVKATTAANIHGAKVWANGGTSSAVTAETVLVNNAQVWANGAASNTIVAEMVNILNEGKVWASGGTSSAVVSGNSGNVAVVSEDGKGQVWTTINGVSTVKAIGTAEINNLNVWANGQSSKAVNAATAKIKGAQVWTNGNFSEAVSANTAIVHDANVWADGSIGGMAIFTTSGTATVSSNSRVWANGVGGMAIFTTGGTVTVSSNSQVWADDVGGIAIYALGGTANVSNSQVWSNESRGTAIYALSGTANVSNSRVWSNGSRGTAIIAKNVEIEGSDVWTEEDSSVVEIISGISSVNSSNLTAYKDGKVFVLDAIGGDVTLNLHNSTIGFEGADGEFFDITGTDNSGKVIVRSHNSSFWMGENGATVFSTTIDESGTVTNRIDELERTDLISIFNINRVWANGRSGSAFSLDHQGVADEEVKISEYFNAQQAWTEGQRSNTIRIKTENGHVLFNTSGKVWANGSRSSAISVETGSGNVSIIGTDMWTKLQRSNTVHIKTGTGDVSFVTTGKVSAKGPRSSAISVETGGENVFIIGAEIKAEKNYSNAVHIKTGTEDVSFTIGGKIWANKKNSSAVFVESGGGNVSIETDSIIDTRIWTEMHNSNTVRIKTGTGDVSFNTGGTIWAEGENSSAVFAESNGGTVSLSSPDGEIWTEGNFSTTVFANTAVTVRGLKIWTSGKESNAIVAQNVSINGSDVWTEKNDSFVVTVKSGNSSVNNSNFTVGNEGGAAFVLGANGGDITLDLHNSTIGFNEGSSGQFFKVSNTGNETVSVESLNSSFWMGGDGATVFSTIVEADGAVKNRLGGFELADSIVISDINRVWAKGTNSSAFFFNHQGAAVDYDGDEYLKISSYFDFDAKQAWTEGDNSETIRIKTGAANISFTTGGKIWANGANSSAISAESNGSGAVFIRGAEALETWTEGNNSKTIYVKTETGNASFTTGDNSKIWANGANSSAIIAQTNTGDANIEIGANRSVWTNGVNSVAVMAEATGAGHASVYTQQGAKIFTNAANSVAVLVRMNGRNVVVIHSAGHTPRSQPRSSHADSSAESGGVELNIANGAIVCGGALSGSTCTPGADSYAVRFEADDGVGGDTKIIIGAGGYLGGAVSFSESRDVVIYNNGSFTGSGTTGDGDDTVENRGTITLSDSDFDMGDGNDTVENKEAITLFGGDFDMGDGDDTVENRGTITLFGGDLDMGDGDDTVENRGTFILFGGDFDMGDGDGTVENRGTFILVGGTYGGGQSAQSSAGFRVRHGETEPAHSTQSSGGEGRFRLSAASPASAPSSPETPTINFGGGEDTFINNGKMVIEEAGGFNGLDKISFGTNSTLVVSADPEKMADKPLIDIEGEITAEDIEGFSVRVDVPGTHINEYTIFEADDLLDGEKRQEVVDLINEKIGERASVEADGNGNLFVRATSHKDTSLDVYDALIQSAYRSDRNFADKLARGCGTGGAASDEIDGDFWTGCVWATSGGRYTRHTSAIQYDEDVYSFTGGASAPFSGVLVSVAGGYEISTIDASAETAFDEDTRGLAKAGGDATRFMGGIFAEGAIDEFVVDGNLRYVSTNWEATRTADGDRYSADVDATVFGGAIAVTKPFLSGKVALLPRLELGASYITADKFTENSLTTTGTDAEIAAADMDKFHVDETSELLVYVSPSIEARSPVSEMLSMWMRAGADVQVLNPESEIEGRLIRDGENDGDPDVPENVLRDGTMDRVMFTYSAGMEYNPYDRLNISIEYGGGTSTSFNTFIQQFRGGFNYKF